MADCLQGRNLVYFVVYSLDATRCIILHLAATQSLQHASDRPDCLLCGLAVGAVAIVLGQVGAPCIMVCLNFRPLKQTMAFLNLSAVMTSEHSIALQNAACA